MKKIILLITLILLLTSCNDYTEINDLAIASGMMIDYTNNTYEITMQLIINEKESTIKIYNVKSKSIEEALSKITKLSNKKIFISHLKTLILTTNVIENNADIYDFFLRNSKSKMNFYTYIINQNEKNKILNIYNKEENSSIYLEKIMEFNEKKVLDTTPLKFIDLIYYQKEPYINAVYPTLTVDKNNNIVLDNLITYNNKNEMLKLNSEESIFYNIITNKSKNTSITIKCNNDDNYYSLDIQNIKTKFKFKNNTLYIKNTSNAKITSYECKEKLNNIKSINNLNKITNKYITKNINNLIKLIKENNNDFIGIGSYIYKHNNKEFNKNYLDIIKIKVSSDIKINSEGEIRR